MMIDDLMSSYPQVKPDGLHFPEGICRTIIFIIIKFMKKLLLFLIVALTATSLDARQIRVQGHLVTTLASGDNEKAPEGEDQGFSFSDIINWTGEGNRKAALILQWNDDREENAIVFGYRFDGEKTGFDMLNDILKANPRLYGLFYYTDLGYTVGGLGWDIDGDGEIFLRSSSGDLMTAENGMFEITSYDFDRTSAADPNDLWASGWTEKGYWSYWVKENDTDSFSYSQLGVSNLTLTDGMWNAWTFRSFSSELGPWKTFVPAPLPDEDISFTVNNVHYSVRSKSLSTVAVVSAENGNNDYSGIVSIPATVEHDGITYSVCYIDNEAFANSSVTEIDLTAINRTLTVGDKAFANCPDLTSVKFSNHAGPHRFGSRLFENSTSLTSVVMGDNSTFERIGDHIFSGCSALSEEGIPALFLNSAVIPQGQFEGTGLQNISLKTVKEIGDDAFANCAALSNITLGTALLKIGERAFDGCSAIKSITVSQINPADVAESAFSESTCQSATLKIPYSATANYTAHNVWNKFLNIEEDNAIIAAGAVISVDDINYRVYIDNSGNISLAVSPKSYSGTISIPETVSVGDESYPVTAIDDYAFSGRTLTGISIPDNVTRIGNSAFRNTKFPTDYQVNLPAFVNKIGTSTFSGSNVAIVSRTLSTGQPTFTEVPDSMFCNCSSLFSTFILTDKLEKVGNYAFYSTKVSGDLSNAPFKWVGDKAFYSYSSSVTLPVPETLTHIGAEAYYRQNFAGGTLTLRPGVEYGSACFSGLKNLGEIEILDGVKELTYRMFYSTEAKNFKNDYIPESLTVINDEALRSCMQFSGAIHIPATLQKLGSRAFEWTISSEVTVPDECQITTFTSAFNGMDNLTTIHIPSSVTEIATYALSRCTSLRKITGAKNVKTIGLGAFANCSALEEFTIPEGVTEINVETFMFCSSLKVIDIPSSVTYIYGQSFRNLTSLTDLVLPESLEYIKEYNGYGAFDGSNQDANIWYCMNTLTKFKSYNYVDAGYAVNPFRFFYFSHYYVLHGMKNEFLKVHKSSPYPYEEVTVTIDDVACEHAIDENNVCNMTAKTTLSQGTATRDALNIPESFAKANRKHFNSNVAYSLNLMEELPDGATISIDNPDSDEDGNHTVTGSIAGLPNGTYHYQLVAKHTDGTSAASGWKEFTINNMTGVSDISTDAGTSEPVAYFNVTGQRSDKPFKGLNIVIYKDGHSEKIFVK